LYGIRKVLKTGKEYLTERQKTRLATVFANSDLAPVQATYDIYQKIVAAYRDPNRKKAKKRLRKLIDAISHGIPNTLTELQTLGRTMKRRAADILAYFDHVGTSNGPPKPSTAESNTCAAPHWASETSPTTSPEHCSTPADSDTNYTHFYDEPVKAPGVLLNVQHTRCLSRVYGLVAQAGGGSIRS